MFHSVLRQHRQSHASASEKVTQSRTAVLQSLDSLSSLLVRDLNSSTSSLFHHQRALDSETKKFLTSTNKFSKQIEQWQTSYNELNEAVKELGDISNWAKELDEEMAAIAVALSTVMAIKEHEKTESKIQQNSQNESKSAGNNSTSTSSSVAKAPGAK
jgi:hypothetical protein